MNKLLISLAAFSTLGISVQHAAFAATFTTTIDAATYLSSGTITFDDWGYKGPAGVGANDFQVGSGFNSGVNNSNIGQIQHVITKDPDYLTPDAETSGPWMQPTVVGDLFNTPTYTTPNMDAGVSFYHWAYTSPANSTFSNMKIDKAGNYSIAKTDMSFNYYDLFQYRDASGANPDQTLDTRINFQPYAISDAHGWCGSVLNMDPNGVGVMAGQVTFNFAMDVFFDFGSVPTYSSTQLISGFIMRSYGDVVVDVSTSGGDRMLMNASAVGNNTNPTSIVRGVGGTLDPAYQNKVSFHGAGVLPAGVWVSADSFVPVGSSTKKMRTDYNPTTGTTGSVWDVTIVPEGTAGAVWHANAFAGYAFILRADAARILDYVNPKGHSDYVCPCWTETELARITSGNGGALCSSTATTATIRDNSPIQYATVDSNASLPNCRFVDTTTAPATSRRISGISPVAAQVCYTEIRQACTSLGL